MSQPILFYAFAALIVFCAVMVITSRNPVTSAVFLIADLFLLAGLYAMMEAHFVAAIQILVYAGAVVVLFMFVIMLLNQGPDARAFLRLTAGEGFVLLATLVAFIAMAGMVGASDTTSVSGDQTVEAIAKAGGNTYAAAMQLFTKFLWPFELASILILLAIVACVVIAKKDKPTTKTVAGKRGAHGAR